MHHPPHFNGQGTAGPEGGHGGAAGQGFVSRKERLTILRQQAHPHGHLLETHGHKLPEEAHLVLSVEYGFENQHHKDVVAKKQKYGAKGKGKGKGGKAAPGSIRFNTDHLVSNSNSKGNNPSSKNTNNSLRTTPSTGAKVLGSMLQEQ